MADYVVVDFETANYGRDSACAIGVVKVVNSKVVEAWESLIDPQQKFALMNVQIHHIDELTVYGGPKFPAVLDRLVRTARGTEALVAHNAAFDMEVLAASAARYGERVPNFNYACTLQFSRAWFPERQAFDLAGLVTDLGIDTRLGSYNHHNALWDARAAQVLAGIGLQKTGAATWNEAAIQAEVPLGVFQAGAVTRPVGHSVLESANIQVDPSGRFRDRSVCFVGEFRLIESGEATRLLEIAGGRLDDTVTKSLDILVKGYVPKEQGMTPEEEEATSLIRSGHQIQIISEKEFYLAIYGFKRNM